MHSTSCWHTPSTCSDQSLGLVQLAAKVRDRSDSLGSVRSVSLQVVRAACNLHVTSRAVVLNMWVTTPLGLNDPFTGLHTRCFTYLIFTIHN